VGSTAGISDTPQKVVLERRTSPQSTTQLIAFDATVRITHSSRVEVTDHPVEDGSVVSDHSRRLPKRLTLDVVVSNDPIIVDAQANAQPSVAGGDPRQRAQDAYQELESIQERGELVTVRLFLRDYDNMIVEDMGAQRDAATGNVLSAALSLRELITATTERVQAPEPASTDKSPRQNTGRQNTTESPPEDQAKAEENISLLSSLFGG
jgi:ribosomal protein L12E/L44/L45/RPP1/RPP2